MEHPPQIIDITEQNLDKYNLFCHQSKKKGEGYQNKVKWFKDCFKDGLKLKILNVFEEHRGYKTRGFIEYAPGEKCWRGIQAKNYMVIHCIWVVGSKKGKGYGTKLLHECIKDAQGMNGIAVVTSEAGWLPKDKLFIKNGFEKVDEQAPFQLYVLRFNKNAELPCFNKATKEKLTKYKKGLTLFVADQCPYMPLAIKSIENVAREENIPLQKIKLVNCQDAQENPSPYGVFGVLLNGKVITSRPTFYKELKEKIAREKNS